jgi:hypothetical protein
MGSGDDVDHVRFYGQATSQIFGINFSNCFGPHEACGRNDGHGVAFSRNDGAVYSIKIFRTPNTAGTCTPYTVYTSNG